MVGHSVVIISRRTPRSSRRHPFIILFMNLLASDSFIGQINNKMPNSRKRAHSSLWSNRRMFGYRIETACLVISCFINWQFHFLHVNLCESHRQDKWWFVCVFLHPLTDKSLRLRRSSPAAPIFQHAAQLSPGYLLQLALNQVPKCHSIAVCGGHLVGR